MQRLEVSGAVRPTYVSLGIRRLIQTYDAWNHELKIRCLDLLVSIEEGTALLRKFGTYLLVDIDCQVTSKNSRIFRLNHIDDEEMKVAVRSFCF